MHLYHEMIDCSVISTAQKVEYESAQPDSVCSLPINLTLSQFVLLPCKRRRKSSHFDTLIMWSLDDLCTFNFTAKCLQSLMPFFTSLFVVFEPNNMQQKQKTAYAFWNKPANFFLCFSVWQFSTIVLLWKMSVFVISRKDMLKQFSKALFPLACLSSILLVSFSGMWFFRINTDFCIFRPLRYDPCDSRRSKVFCFWVEGGRCLLHDDWNHTNGLKLLPKINCEKIVF